MLISSNILRLKCIYNYPNVNKDNSLIMHEEFYNTYTQTPTLLETMVFDVFSCHSTRAWNGNFRPSTGIDTFGYASWDSIPAPFIDRSFEFRSVAGRGWILARTVGRRKESRHYVLSFFRGSLLSVVKRDALCTWNLRNRRVWEEMPFVMGERNLLLLCLLLFTVSGRVEGATAFCKQVVEPLGLYDCEEFTVSNLQIRYYHSNVWTAFLTSSCHKSILPLVM